MPDDEDLMVRFYACDSSAFDELARRWWLPLCSRFRRQCEICGNRGRAADLTQETLVKVFATKDQKPGSRYSTRIGAYRSWLFQVADNVHRDAHRHDQRHPEEQLRPYEIGEEA